MAVTAKQIGAALLTLTVSLTLGACSPRQPDAKPVDSAHVESAAPTVDTRPVIVAFGDSLTAGYGVEPGKSYPDDLQRLLDAAAYKYHVVNLGVSGDTTTDGLQRVADVLAAKPAIVILEFGGNDGLQNAGIQVLLAGMSLPRNYGPDYIRSFEKVYTDVATQFHLARIPFLLEGVGGHPELLQADGIHPTAQGCEIVSTNVMRYLTPLLQK